MKFGKTILQLPPPDDRSARIECLRLAVEMRTGAATAAALVGMADELYRYADTGKKETQGRG